MVIARFLFTCISLHNLLIKYLLHLLPNILELRNVHFNPHVLLSLEINFHIH